MYRLLTGKLPFTGDSFAAAAQAILTAGPAPPESINPDVSPALGGVVLRCLAKDSADRFASAEEVKQALDALALGLPVPNLATDATAMDDSGSTRPLGSVVPPVEPKAPHLTRTRLLYATIAVPVFPAAIVLFLVLPAFEHAPRRATAAG